MAKKTRQVKEVEVEEVEETFNDDIIEEGEEDEVEDEFEEEEEDGQDMNDWEEEEGEEDGEEEGSENGEEEDNEEFESFNGLEEDIEEESEVEKESEEEDGEEEESEKQESLKKRRKIETEPTLSFERLDEIVVDLEGKLSMVLGMKSLLSNENLSSSQLFGVLQSFPEKEILTKLEQEEKQEFVTQATDLNLQLLRLLKKLMFFYSQIKNVSQEKNQKGKKKGKGKSIPVSQQPEMLFDVALKDIELNLKLPVTKQYIEIGIWKNVQKINLELQRTMSKITDKSSQQKKELKQTGEDQNKTFKDFFLSEMTTTFGDDLNALRQEESFDSSKVSLIVDCLETGMSIFNNLEKELALASIKPSKSQKPIQSQNY